VTLAPARSRTAPLALAGAAAAVAIVLGLYRLDYQPIWLDEFVAINVGQAELERFVHRITTDQSYTALYYLLLRGWLSLGDSAWVARLPSVLFAAASVVAVFFLARRLFGRLDVAALAALLTATNGFVIRYAQEARAYSLAMLLATVATLALIWALERDSWRRWLVYGATAALAIYGHLFAGFVVAVHALVTAGRRRLTRRAIGGFAVAALLVVPLAISQALYRHGFSWIEEPSWRSLPRIVHMLAGGPADAERLPVNLVVFGAAAALGLGFGLRQPDRWRAVLLLGWVLVPLVAAFAGSLVVQPMIVARYFLISTPPLMILAAYGALGVQPGWLRWLAVAALFAAAAYGLAWLYVEFTKPAFVPG
jgi:mannosyltransferase